MKASLIRSIAGGLLGAITFLGGCLSPPDSALVEEGEGTEGMALRRRAIAPIGVNGLSPDDLWAPANRSALQALGHRALLDGSGRLATSLLDTAGGRGVLDYAVRCALPTGTVVQAPDGEPFEGAFGLAPGWSDRALTVGEQRWVSGCVFQHLNGSGAHVEVLLQGRHPALACPSDEAPFSEFIQRDATMFGNLFASGAVVGYTCIDPSLLETLAHLELSNPLDLQLLALERPCGHSSTCGIAFLGLCDLFCSTDAAGDQTCSLLPLGEPLLTPLVCSVVAPLLGLTCQAPVTFQETVRTRIRDCDLLPLYGEWGLL